MNELFRALALLAAQSSPATTVAVEPAHHRLPFINLTVSRTTWMLLNRGGAVIVTVVAALIALRLVPVLERLVIRWATRHSKDGPGGATSTDMDSRQRVETLTRVTGSVARAMIWTATLITVLGNVGIAIGPLLAGAGIAGVAIGFGAQSIVKDFFSGFFILLENQFDVGDLVTINSTTGTVERMTMRITVVRDSSGTAYFFPNSAITSVANKTYGWGRANVDVVFKETVAESEARGLLEAVTRRAAEMPGMDGVMTEPPYVEGPVDFAPGTVTWKLVCRTTAGRGGDAKRALIVSLQDEMRARGFLTEGGSMAPSAPVKVGASEPAARP